MARQYRAIVIGCGAVGAATTYWLSRQLGGEVLALEQYQHGHSRGASEDHSWVIRHGVNDPAGTWSAGGPGHARPDVERGPGSE